MKDYRIMPKVVLFEGINMCGKTTLVKQFKELYPKQIEVIKFPRQQKIIRQIEFLFKEIKRQGNIGDGIDIKVLGRYLGIIHQLFDLDFRQFSTVESIKDLSKVYFLDRYYPSNLVYCTLHGLEPTPQWFMNHELKPDVAIFLEVKDGITYQKKFPVYDTDIVVNSEETGDIKRIQMLTPNTLFNQGQDAYRELFPELLKQKKIENYEVVNALQEDTFRNVEKILMRHQIL